MALLVNSGRAGLAAALKARPLHVACGRGDSWWGQPAVLSATLTGTLPFVFEHSPILSAVVRDQAGAITFTEGADYVLDLTAGTIRRATASGIPSGATVQILVTYGTPGPSSGDAVLVNEIGRRAASSVSFVVPDATGTITTPDGSKWSISTAASRWLYVSALFEFDEAANEMIREVGIFADTVRKSSVPVGRLYLAPDDIEDAGYMLLLDRLPGLQRTPSSRQGFSYVMVI